MKVIICSSLKDITISSLRVGDILNSLKSPDKRKQRDAYLRRTYQISLAEYESLAARYNGGCWICRKPPKPGKSLAVDHDHKLAKEAKCVRRSVRGILCFVCNKRLIGRRRREHAELYKRAYEYLLDTWVQDRLGGRSGK